MILLKGIIFLSKIFNEKILQLSNLNYLILRPHNIYGPRMGFSHVIPELIQRMTNLKKGKIKKYLFFLQNIKELLLCGRCNSPNCEIIVQYKN